MPELDHRTSLEFPQLRVIPGVGFVTFVARTFVLERQLGQAAGFSAIRDRPLDLDIAEDAQVQEELLQGSLEASGNLVEVPNAPVPTFKYPFCPRLDALKYPRKTLSNTLFARYSSVWPGVVRVDVQVEQAQSPLGRREVSGLVFFDVLFNVFGTEDVPKDILVMSELLAILMHEISLSRLLPPEKLPIFLGDEMERPVTDGDAAIVEVDERLERFERIRAS